jgi:hypothetical protein
MPQNDANNNASPQQPPPFKFGRFEDDDAAQIIETYNKYHLTQCINIVIISVVIMRPQLAHQPALVQQRDDSVWTR